MPLHLQFDHNIRNDTDNRLQRDIGRRLFALRLLELLFSYTLKAAWLAGVGYAFLLVYQHAIP